MDNDQVNLQINPVYGFYENNLYVNFGSSSSSKQIELMIQNGKDDDADCCQSSENIKQQSSPQKNQIIESNMPMLQSLNNKIDQTSAYQNQIIINNATKMYGTLENAFIYGQIRDLKHQNGLGENSINIITKQIQEVKFQLKETSLLGQANIFFQDFVENYIIQVFIKANGASYEQDIRDSTVIKICTVLHYLICQKTKWYLIYFHVLLVLVTALNTYILTEIEKISESKEKMAIYVKFNKADNLGLILTLKAFIIAYIAFTWLSSIMTYINSKLFLFYVQRNATIFLIISLFICAITVPLSLNLITKSMKGLILSLLSFVLQAIYSVIQMINSMYITDKQKRLLIIVKEQPPEILY